MVLVSFSLCDTEQSASVRAGKGLTCEPLVCEVVIEDCDLPQLMDVACPSETSAFAQSLLNVAVEAGVKKEGIFGQN